MPHERIVLVSGACKLDVGRVKSCLTPTLIDSTQYRVDSDMFCGVHDPMVKLSKFAVCMWFVVECVHSM